MTNAIVLFTGTNGAKIAEIGGDKAVYDEQANTLTVNGTVLHPGAMLILDVKDDLSPEELQQIQQDLYGDQHR